MRCITFGAMGRTMTQPVQFLDWRFAQDFSSADHSKTAESIAFTRAERALLQVFAVNPAVVLPRRRLLDAMAGDDPISDRNVDFTINRLRRKLGDSAREARYIATQYGEGYAWVAQRVQTQSAAAGAFIVVGPVRGLHSSGHLAAAGWALIRGLVRELGRCTPRRQIVALDLDCSSADAFGDDPPEFAVHLSFIQVDAQRLDCAAALKRFAAGVIVSIDRLRLSVSGAKDRLDNDTVRGLTRRLLTAIRGSLTYTLADAGPDFEPLAIRQQHAALTLAKGRPQWDKTVERLEAQVRERPEDDEAAAKLSATRSRQAMAANQAAEREYREALRTHPNDPETQLLLAQAIHSRYLFAGRHWLADATQEVREQHAAEIESLVMSALPELQDNGIFALTAAKLLYFANKTHRALALELVDGALSTTTAFATAFITAGQLYAWEACIDEALGFYERALELGPNITDFRLYVQVLQCYTLTARGDHQAAAVIATDMYQRSPATRIQLCLFFAATEDFDLAPTLEYTLGGLDAHSARGHIRYVYYLTACHFKRRAHRRNLMRRPLRVLVDRFGEGCLPDEIRPDIEDGLLSKTG